VKNKLYYERYCIFERRIEMKNLLYFVVGLVMAPVYAITQACKWITELGDCTISNYNFNRRLKARRKEMGA
jgi:hypothetical protein